MKFSGLMANTFYQAEVEYRRERAMQEYARRPRRAHSWRGITRRSDSPRSTAGSSRGSID